MFRKQQLKLGVISHLTPCTVYYHLMHVLSHSCDTDKLAFPFVVRLTFMKPWFKLETLYSFFSWGMFEQIPAF